MRVIAFVIAALLGASPESTPAPVQHAAAHLESMCPSAEPHVLAWLDAAHAADAAGAEREASAAADAFQRCGSGAAMDNNERRLDPSFDEIARQYDRTRYVQFSFATARALQVEGKTGDAVLLYRKVRAMADDLYAWRNSTGPGDNWHIDTHWEYRDAALEISKAANRALAELESRRQAQATPAPQPPH